MEAEEEVMLDIKALATTSTQMEETMEDHLNKAVDQTLMDMFLTNSTKEVLEAKITQERTVRHGETTKILTKKEEAAVTVGTNMMIMKLIAMGATVIGDSEI